jgi:TonB dependent receptor
LQDDWKVNSKLTLNLGVRYEYATPQWERDNRLSNFDPVSNSLILATDGSIADRAQVNPDRNNWAPRFGFAYGFNPQTVMRGGYGVSYIHFNRAGGGNILGINGPQVVTAALSQSPTTPGFRTTQEGYPVGLTDPDKFNPILANISYIPRDTRTGYVQNWALSIQREILGGTILDLGYIGNKSTNLILFADYNQARPNRPGENLSVQARRPNQAFGPITVTWPGGFANYHAFQAKLERRFRDGLYLLNSFVYSKAIDNTGQALEDQGNGGRSSPQNFYDLRAEKAVSDFDQTFNNTTSVVYELPFGKGRKYLSSTGALTDHVLGGWQMTVINNMWSGEPINLSYNPAGDFQVSVASIPDWRGGISYRPNVIGPVGMSLQFRAEAFNLFNKTNFRQTDRAFSNISDSRFGQVRGTYPARQIQFGLRLTF